MPLDHIGDFPRLRRVASNAVRSELCFVHVGVAGSAAAVGPGEFEIGVTTDARDALVCVGEREPGLSVVEFRVRPHRPGVRRMAGPTRDFDIPVRGILGAADTHPRCREQQEKQNRLPLAAVEQMRTSAERTVKG